MRRRKSLLPEQRLSALLCIPAPYTRDAANLYDLSAFGAGTSTEPQTHRTAPRYTPQSTANRELSRATVV